MVFETKAPYIRLNSSIVTFLAMIMSNKKPAFQKISHISYLFYFCDTFAVRLSTDAFFRHAV